MLKIFAIIGIVLVVTIAGLLIFASTKPNVFRVTRSITIQAPPEKIFPLIADFHDWTSWSPYENRDPAMQRSFSGAASGQGAIYEWSGNKDIGQGRMETTHVEEPSEGGPAKIVIKLDFFAPFEAHNTAEFTMTPIAGGTDVTWSMFGPAPFISKVMQVFINMDRMVGDDFATGLVNLKTVAEK